MSDFPYLPTCAGCGESTTGPGLCLDCRDAVHRRIIVENYTALGRPMNSGVVVIRKTAQEVEEILAALNRFTGAVIFEDEHVLRD